MTKKPANICKPTTVSEHFLGDHHMANDVSLISFELVNANCGNIHEEFIYKLVCKDTPVPIALYLKTNWLHRLGYGIYEAANYK